ncbi:LLM class flavin-dependent oxidoreductase [Blastococcus sp. PRF04-17]|nr:LLM class flavin-dependent oxidoreductase [Blastococcus sp. PRF04-17]
MAIAVEAEHLGVEEVWVSEDYCERGAFALAGAVAQATSRVRVGLGVVNPWTRHPVLLAMEFAALDELAEGRAVLGLGASNARWMQEDLGIPFQRPLARLRECVDVLRPLLAGKRVDHDGSAWQVHAQLAFTPARPAPPLILGVKGENAIALAAETGDGVLLSLLAGPSYIGWARQVLGPDADVSSYVAFSCDTDASAARDRIRPLVARFLGVHGEHQITRCAGVDPDLAAAFRAGLLAGAPRVDLVDDALLDAVAVAGDLGDCRAGIRRLASAGLDCVVLSDDVPEAELLAVLEAVTVPTG